MKPTYFVALVSMGLLVLSAQAIGIFAGDIVPSLTSPLPYVFAFPLFFGLPYAAVLVLLPFLFCVWAPSLWQGKPLVPRRTLVLVALGSVASLSNYLFGWSFGVQYQGLRYTASCALLSAVMLLAVIFLLRWNRTSPSYAGALAVQAILFAWHGSYAFAYLGETP